MGELALIAAGAALLMVGFVAGYRSRARRNPHRIHRPGPAPIRQA